MSVYVDNARNQLGRMLMCHMTADSFRELYDMVDKIGVDKRWLQNMRFPHYDRCQAKRKLAVKHGALEITTREIIKKGKELRMRQID